MLTGEKIAYFLVGLIALPFLVVGAFFVQDSLTRKAYTLSDGKTVMCNVAIQSYCGLSLYLCDDSVQYLCQTDVKGSK